MSDTRPTGMTPTAIEAVLLAHSIALGVLLRSNPTAQAEMRMCLPWLEEGALFQPLSEGQHALLMTTLRMVLELSDKPAAPVAEPA